MFKEGAIVVIYLFCLTGAQKETVGKFRSEIRGFGNTNNKNKTENQRFWLFHHGT